MQRLYDYVVTVLLLRSIRQPSTGRRGPLLNPEADMFVDPIQCIHHIRAIAIAKK
jgi:hypothetical protein